MRFIIQGERTSGKTIDYSLDDYNIARFEFSALEPVSNYVVLYQEDKGRLKQLNIYVRG